MMKKYFNSPAVGALAIVGLGLGMAGNAAADTVDFTDNGSFSTPSLTEGSVTVTGSDDLVVIDNDGLSVLGGVSSFVLDPGETMSFSFASPVSNVVIGDYQAFDTDGNGLALDATLQSFDENGGLTGTVVTQFDGSLPIEVSNILGVPSLSSFDITMNFDGIRVGSVSFQEAGSDISEFSCAGFDSPFAEPLSIKKKTKKTIPVKMSLTDVDGFNVTDLNVVAAPVINVEFNGVVFGDGTTNDENLESVGNSNQGNSFSFNNDNQTWEYRLGTKQFSGTGTYTVSVTSGDNAEYTIDAVGGACLQIFVRQP